MHRSGLWLSLLICICLPSLLAQDAPVVRTGNTEIGGFVGASYGIDKARVMGGANVCYALTKVIMPYGEFSYFPGIGRKETLNLGTGSATFNFSMPLSDIHGGVHLRIPIKESRVVPYGVLGLGVVHYYSRTENVTVSDAVGQFTVPVTSPSSNNFAVNFGGGLRFYLSEMFGIRVEAKAYKPTGSVTDMFGKVEGGFFFQLK